MENEWKTGIKKQDIFTFDLNWSSPETKHIMKILISIPQYFCTTALYRQRGSDLEKYYFRGMVCERDRHYIAYFRRSQCKLVYLAGLPRINI